MALHGYTRELYQDLNTALREDDTYMIAQMSGFATTLSAGLAKLPIHTGYVHRVTDLPYDIIGELMPGAIFTDMAFMSASAKKSPFTGTVEFVIYSRSGRRIEGYSNYPNETEVLFPAGTDFRVIKVEEGDESLRIWMKEI